MAHMFLAVAILLALAQTPEKITLPGASNVTRVDAALMCAGATSPEAFSEIKKLGFSSIINLRQDGESNADIPGAKAAAESAGLKYVHVPVHPSAPSDESVKMFLNAVQDPANQPMFIHCGSANRVAAMWLIKRVVVDGWDMERATTEAEAIGLTSPALKKFALSYVANSKR